MAKRRSKIEVLEDDFFDLALEEKRRLMPVLQGLLRQQERSGAGLADAEVKKRLPAVEVLFTDEASKDAAQYPGIAGGEALHAVSALPVVSKEEYCKGEN